MAQSVPFRSDDVAGVPSRPARRPAPRSRPLGRALALGAGLALGLCLAACGGGKLAAGANVDRSTPENTFAYFKAAAQARDFEAEWSVFSPNFKRQMNEAVGRNVSFADYQLARNTIATNSQADMQLLLQSRLDNVQLAGTDAAVLTISAGGQTLRPRLVRMLMWELRVKGDPEPFSDVLRGGDVVANGPDGSITVRIPANAQMAAALKAIPPANLESLQVESRWYVDDFGGLEGALGSAAPAEAAPTSPGSPGAPPPTPSSPPPEGYGSPG